LEALESRTTPSTFLVTNAQDPAGRLVPGSLRWAIAQANAPRQQNPVVALTPTIQGTITLHGGALRIQNALTFVNASGGAVTLAQATPNARVLEVTANPRTNLVTLAGGGPTPSLSLTGGYARNANGGGILVDNPRNVLELDDVSVGGNAAAQVTNPARGAGGNGGGVYSRGAVTLVHSSVSNNTAFGLNSASGHAGGVYTDQGLVLIASHVDGNSARNAAGILNVFGSVEITSGSTVNDNHSNGNALPQGDLGGGGISQMDGNVFVSASQVNGNQTIGMYSGGIVLLLGGVTVTNGSQVDGNTNNGPGGGIAANFGGAVVIDQGSQVDGNTGAGFGGGIVNWSENFGIDVLDRSEVANNTLTNAEDAKGAAGLGLLFTDPSIETAFVGGGRGDSALRGALQLFVAACGQRLGIINQSSAMFPAGGNVELGAGLSSPFGAPIEITGGSAITGNHFGTVPTSTKPALGDGGAVFSNLGPIAIDASTISGNTASGDGGGIWNGLSLTISGSTVTRNQAGGLGGGVFNRGTFSASNSQIVKNAPDDIYQAE
jgi:hypothetical protein